MSPLSRGHRCITAEDEFVDQKLLWEVNSGGSIGSVDQNGIVTFTGPGTIVVRATSMVEHNGFQQYAPWAQCTITVEQPVESIVITNKPTEPIVTGDVIALKTKIMPTNATDQSVVWTSANESIVTVDQDGKVTAVYGTHTHVQTADDRILPKGTAYITDIGMTGPKVSILGMDKEAALKRFLTALPEKYKIADGECMLNACIFEVDDYTTTVILMTDGDSNNGSLKDLSSYYSSNKLNIPIYGITFGNSSEYQLQKIADLTNGKVFDGKSGLKQAFKEVRSYN